MLYSNMLKSLISIIILVSLYSCDKAQSLEVAPAPTPMSPIHPVRIVKTGEVKRGQGLFQALKSVSIENSQALKLINELRDEIEFSKLKVGDQLEATFNEDQELVKFSYSQNQVEKHVVTLNENNGLWNYSFQELETFWQPRTLEGELRPGSTLENDLIASGLKRSVVNEVVNVLLCKVNFRMNARKGDRYKVLLSERKFKDQIISSKVLFTSYQGKRAGTHEAFLYEDEVKNSTYTAHYTKDGQALISSGLRYPLARLHVRSGYGWRKHPVTGKRAMHRGVDLRGRHGTKVHAAAAGKVVISTFNKFAGNKIGIKHKDGSISFYYHLAKRKVHKGAWVRSHQVIGTVGSTGRVTGAHLHFGFKKPNGKWMNPLNKRMIATPKLKGKRYANLLNQITHIKGTLADLEISKDVKYVVANLDNVRRQPSNFEDFIMLPSSFEVE